MLILATAMFAAVYIQAAALSEAVNTPFRAGVATGYLQASNVVYGGAIAAIDTTTGKIVPATDSTASMMVVGCVRQTSDNGGIDASKYSATRKVPASRGVFRWDNGDSYTAADVGQVCYIEDDHTVQKAASATYDIPVGIIVEVDSDGVWVDTTSLSKVLAGSLATLTVSGNASVGGTFDATGNSTVAGTLGVTSTTTLGALTTTGTTTLGGTTVAVTNDATVAGTFAVTGAITGSSTVAATGYKIGAVSGMSGIKTNSGTGYTNLWYFSGGLLTNVSFTGAMP
jgi:hypothetical protein